MSFMEMDEITMEDESEFLRSRMLRIVACATKILNAKDGLQYGNFTILRLAEIAPEFNMEEITDAFEVLRSAQENARVPYRYTTILTRDFFDAEGGEA